MYIFKDITEIEKEDFNLIKLENLTEKEQGIINPLVPPTSGLRMEFFTVIRNEDKEIIKYIMTKKKLFHFLRVLKAFAVITKEELSNNNPSILIVTDDRPSGDMLLDYASRIFTYENYKVYHQTGEGEKTPNSSYIRGKSKMGTPHASASVILLEQINVVLMITASHNTLEWNGLKYYIKRPIPLSGEIMKKMSSYALSLKEIKLAKNYKAELLDADKVNNDYILNLVKKIVNLDILNGKKVIIWPLLGVAPEIISLLESCGIEVILIEDDLNPPNPNESFDENRVKELMNKEGVNVSIILDADRDRLVFLIRIKEKIHNLSPNELYTAMHNILSKKMGKNIINVRTIPSDPRCDINSKINYITGVGYKHLGLIQYLIADIEVPPSQLDVGILYYLKEKKYIKLRNKTDIKKEIKNASVSGELIFVLWEESGGHTFNILNAEIIGGKVTITSEFPLIGDKYPAPAILVLCTLIEMGYDLTQYIDHSLMSERKYIKATNEEKIKYMKHFTGKVGEDIEIGEDNPREYTVGGFSDMLGNVKIIHLKSEKSDLYIRPSGTGPNIKIYVYGSKESYLDDMNSVAEYMEKLQI
ncbi:MAG: hypothetical protein ACTSWY_12495 [Promethearchaeota archaeon]